MGLSCTKPATVEWRQDPVWGPPEKSPVKQFGHEMHSSPKENLIRAHHNVPASGRPSGGSDGACPDEEEEVEEKMTWSCGDCIGSGAFGKVYMGLNTVSGKLMAVKQIKISSEQAVAVPVAEHVRKLEAEVYVLKQLNHPNIVRYLGTERTEETLNIFLEYVPGGSIASLLGKFGRFNEAIIKIYTRQILLGLEYLHNHGIMHRDIKGANVLLDNSGKIRLADFGASKKIESLATIDSQMKQSIKGTPHWMAPEVIHQQGVGRAADIWSVACTIIEMATGKPPWSHITSQVSVMLHIAQTHDLPDLPAHLSTACRDFLRLCFNRSARDRPNASRLLQHPFLDGLAPSGNPPPLAAKLALGPSLKRLQMDVPSPIQEEGSNGTPSSRGTGTTTSSSASSRRPGFAGTNEELGSRYSPMGAAVRQSQMLLPVAEGSHEEESEQLSAIDEGVASESALDMGGEEPKVQPLNISSFDDFNPVVEPSWNQENASWQVNIGSPTSLVLQTPATTMGFQVLSSPKSAGITQLQIRQDARPGLQHEATEQSITMWVQDHAKAETLRRSQTFSNLGLNPCLSPKQRSGNFGTQLTTGHENKEALWEAELQRELEEQRQEQRKSRAAVQNANFGGPKHR